MQIYAYTLDSKKSEWDDYAVQTWCGNLSWEPHITREGTLEPQSSQLAEPLMFDPVLESGTDVRKLIFI